MRNQIYNLAFFIAIALVQVNGQAQSCMGVSKYYIHLLLSGSGGNLQSFYFEYSHPDESWDFMCEVDSILIGEVGSTEALYKYTFDRNANDDLSEIRYFEEGGAVLSGKLTFDWDYAANLVTIIDYDWENNLWIPYDKNEIDYNASGSLKEVRNFDWDNNQWVADQVTVYESDMFGNITSTTENVPGWGVFYSKIEYAYTPNGKVAFASYYRKYEVTDPWELSGRVAYSYHGNTGIKTSQVYSDWDGSSFCEVTKLTFPNVNGYPSQISYEADTSGTCGQWSYIGTFTEFCWDTSSGRLLKMKTYDDDFGSVEYQMYYDSITGSDCVFTAAKESARNYPLEFAIPNPVSAGQNITIKGLSDGNAFQFVWFDLNGRLIGQNTQTSMSGFQVKVPLVSSGMYLLQIQDLKTGAFGIQKTIIQ